MRDLGAVLRLLDVRVTPDVSDQRDLAIPTAGIVVISLYIAAQLLSDIASLKITSIAGFSLDAGTFIYPLTFTIRDLVHKRLGKMAARRVECIVES